MAKPVSLTAGKGAIGLALPALRGISGRMTGLGATLLSILMIAAFLLAAGGVRLMMAGGDRRKGALMLLAAAVMFGNVLIVTL